MQREKKGEKVVKALGRIRKSNHGTRSKVVLQGQKESPLLSIDSTCRSFSNLKTIKKKDKKKRRKDSMQCAVHVSDFVQILTQFN